ncbi:MAG: U32 family peptidase [Clostridia bacterium]|nr:U32 family peptidase [Clostridia bacterium]
MKRKTNLPELLAPAGSFEALKAAVSAGADAVYIGGKSYGARAYAKNFDIEEIKKAVELCHAHGVKLYVTVNTLIYDREMAELSDYVLALYTAGVDAIISADLGVVSEIRRRVPGMPVHASTQMCVHNTEGADVAASLGCERVVLARELSAENINRVTSECKVETEVFLHGALCVCHSGQCLMSSMVGGRSGNRGECAQPCRLPYGKGYPLSLKDLSLASHIKELIESGVASLKIEGRMKSPEYVYTVTSIYRRLLDEARDASSKEGEELKRAFSRGGFTDGYFVGRTERDMLGVRSAEDKEESKATSVEIPELKKPSVKAECVINESGSSLTLTLGDRSVTAKGAVPRGAETSPLTEAGVAERLMKLGSTPISLDKKDIELAIGEGLNLSPGEINALRRDAVSLLLTSQREEPTTSTFARINTNKQTKVVKSAYFHNANTLREVVKASANALDIFDKIFLPISEYKECDARSGYGAALPPVILDTEREWVMDRLCEIKKFGARELLISSISHRELCRDIGFSLMGDFRLNVTNSPSRAEWQRMGVENIILSPELTLPMARDIGGSVIVYGRIPLMLTERCFIKDNFGCDKCGSAALTDRTGAKFPILREFGHRNIILNSTPTYMGDKQDELRTASLSSHHFIFTTESAVEISNIISAYKKKKPLPFAVRRMGKR